MDPCLVVSAPLAQMCMEPATFMPDNTRHYQCSSHSEDSAVEADCPEGCEAGGYLYDDHDGSKCSDWGNDCCASEIWGEPQTCTNGYLALPVSPDQCLRSHDGCVDDDEGAGCYGCFPPDRIATTAPADLYYCRCLMSSAEECEEKYPGEQQAPAGGTCEYAGDSDAGMHHKALDFRV